MRSFFFCGIFLTLVFYLRTSDGVYDQTYLQDKCSPNGDQIVEPGVGPWSKYGFISGSRGCYSKTCSSSTVRINASAGYHITVRFDYIAAHCDKAVVYIGGATKADDYCGYYTPGVSIYSSENWLRIDFIITEEPNDCTNGFRIYYTAYHQNGCSEGEFKCYEGGRCIPAELKCDSYDNCGDWSDEIAGTCGLSTGAIIAISVMSALVGLACIAFVVYCCFDQRSRRKNTSRGGSSNNNSSSTTTATDSDLPCPPLYTEPPPAYTYVNTVYGGIYDTIPDGPPTYQTVTP